jgi:hypothetical protein
MSVILWEFRVVMPRRNTRKLPSSSPEAFKKRTPFFQRHMFF